MQEQLVLFLTYLLFGLLMMGIGLLLYHGKGGMLLAGWNTMPHEEKMKWDEKRLLRFNGRCLLALGGIVILTGALPLAGLPTGIVNVVGWTLFVLLISWMVIYQNTGNRFRR